MTQGSCVAMPVFASPSSSPTMQRRSSTVAHLQNAKNHFHRKGHWPIKYPIHLFINVYHTSVQCSNDRSAQMSTELSQVTGTVFQSTRDSADANGIWLHSNKCRGECADSSFPSSSFLTCRDCCAETGPHSRVIEHMGLQHMQRWIRSS